MHDTEKFPVPASLIVLLLLCEAQENCFYPLCCAISSLLLTWSFWQSQSLGHYLSGSSGRSFKLTDPLRWGNLSPKPSCFHYCFICRCEFPPPTPLPWCHPLVFFGGRLRINSRPSDDGGGEEVSGERSPSALGWESVESFSCRLCRLWSHAEPNSTSLVNQMSRERDEKKAPTSTSGGVACQKLGINEADCCKESEVQLFKYLPQSTSIICVIATRVSVSGIRHH